MEDRLEAPASRKSDHVLRRTGCPRAGNVLGVPTFAEKRLRELSPYVRVWRAGTYLPYGVSCSRVRFAYRFSRHGVSPIDYYLIRRPSKHEQIHRRRLQLYQHVIRV